MADMQGMPHLYSEINIDNHYGVRRAWTRCALVNLSTASLLHKIANVLTLSGRGSDASGNVVAA